MPNFPIVGVIDAADEAVRASCKDVAVMAVQITGTWTATQTFQATVDGTNWASVPATPVAGGATVTTATANGVWRIDCGGFASVRVLNTAFTSGSATVTLNPCVAGGVSASVASVSVSADTEFPAAAALADNTATPTTTAVGAFGMVYDGATWDFARGDATNGLKVQPAVGGAGAVTSVTGRTTLASDDPAVVSLALLDDTVFTDDAAFTPGTSKVLAVGFQADETAADSVDEGDVGAARMTLDRKVHVVNETESNSMRSGGLAATPKFAVIDHASSGDNTLVAAVASKKIRVTSLFLVAAAAVTIRFESGAGGTALTGQMQVAANGGFVLPFNPQGWFETASNTLLNLELSGAVSVDGSLTYIEAN